MTDKHIGSNFDDFLKEENIHIPIHSEWFLNPLEAYDQIKKELLRKEQECERYKDKFNHIKKSLERIVKSHDVDFDNGLSREMKRIINECEVLEQ